MSRALSGFAEKQKKGERAKGINKLLWREEDQFFQSPGICRNRSAEKKDMSELWD